MNPKRNKPQTVLIRIITNYLQGMLIFSEMRINWPSQLEKTFTALSFLSTTQSGVSFSLDCF
jgi:hypothetical protein